ncbi:DUF92 domain-containing protein [Neolewinella litorea]|uniref:DUF92 domain-containing protein n=1 Tax=Neolewinella litorea TaxID=2562452 RepID=A0A4S4NRG2_9BACT|nr:DUF92 domain-containing protein [Neolewinella litorea]THH41795.1 DUF92 domain-containing protein [Neolewinella litorea]
MGDLTAILCWLLLATAFGVLTVRRGSLSTSGALAAVVLGLTVVFTAGPRWLLPLFAFFASSTLIDRLLPARGISGDVKDRQPRDAVQVFCNGGIYGLVALWGWDPKLLLVAAAVATSDTWASAVGKYFRQPTLDILRLREVPPGLSGGVSVAGTVGGAAGAILIALLGFVVLEGFSWGAGAWVAAFGFCGMVVDSVLGAGLQARYRHEDGGLSDREVPGAQLVAGRAWMTNDLVNLLAIAGATTVAGCMLL